MATASSYSEKSWNDVYAKGSLDHECYYAVIFGDEVFSHKLPTGSWLNGISPIYPDSIQDSVDPRWSSQSILNRNGDLHSFYGSGNRKCSFSFTLHQEAYASEGKTPDLTTWKNTINDLRRGCIAFNKSSKVYPPIVVFKFGDFKIKGVMTSCSFQWEKPISRDNMYQQCKVSVSVTELAPTAGGSEKYFVAGSSPLKPYN